MADYGAPVFPFLAVGGYESELHLHVWTILHQPNTILTALNCVLCFFLDEDYTNAEAFIMTFSLNNFARDNPKFKAALQWEKEFLKIVQDYQKDPAANFTFAYMAEVQ